MHGESGHHIDSWLAVVYPTNQLTAVSVIIGTELQEFQTVCRLLFDANLAIYPVMKLAFFDFIGSGIVTC